MNKTKNYQKTTIYLLKNKKEYDSIKIKEIQVRKVLYLLIFYRGGTSE